MFLTIRYAKFAQSIALTGLLMLTLAACGGTRATEEPSTAQADSS